MGMACDFQYLGKGNQALHSHRMTEMNKMYHCKTTYFSQFLVVVEDYWMMFSSETQMSLRAEGQNKLHGVAHLPFFSNG